LTQTLVQEIYAAEFTQSPNTVQKIRLISSAYARLCKQSKGYIHIKGGVNVIPGLEPVFVGLRIKRKGVFRCCYATFLLRGDGHISVGHFLSSSAGIEVYPGRTTTQNRGYNTDGTRLVRIALAGTIERHDKPTAHMAAAHVHTEELMIPVYL